MNRPLEIEPLAQGCGALVRGVDLVHLDDATWPLVHDAFLEYGVIFFREQDLDPDAHIALARRFGPIVINKFFPESDVDPEIAEVRKEADQQTNIGGGWHTDHSYDEVPALGSILVARELPSQGGDTLFANMYAAYDALSDGLKRTLATLRAVHSNDHLYGAQGIYHQTDLADMLKGKDLVGEAVHPMVVRHPESGRAALYVNPGHTRTIEGWKVEESLPLLSYLYRVQQRPEFSCRFRWSPGALAFWDNRAAQHNALNDYHGHRRVMWRVTLAGDIPA